MQQVLQECLFDWVTLEGIPKLKTFNKVCNVQFRPETCDIMINTFNSILIVYKLVTMFFRGVGMAVKMPSRSLKKDCAGILESLKV